MATFFRQPTIAPPSRTNTTKQLSYFLVVIIVVMVVAQLFSFETFLDFFTHLQLPISYAFAFSLAPIVVTLELFSLPFFLRMRLSPAFRWVSMVCGWLVVTLWLFVSFWTTVIYHGVMSVGYLGTVVDVTPGWWSVFFMMSLCIATAWVSWGLWPYRPQHTSHAH